jgi:hypothetical protein
MNDRETPPRDYAPEPLAAMDDVIVAGARVALVVICAAFAVGAALIWWL